MDQYQKFYQSAAWQTKREQILQRDCYQCQMCVARLKEAAETGTKLAPRDRHIRTSLCADCHNLVHGRTGADKLNFNKKVERLTEEKW